ncbi:hypothetical protein CDES_13595 [Corynebacterium deserti GIMN1.010]|uniref:Uncharacterized protein n=1 Tax=Corynebacterium deserti GIMN1.010 TaxID=931089 RepID=A0A0M3QA85_9CORY|nr:ElyC/SanA/YdcF family protein [Corynebacterium deserti]ALC07049.1 hypothetical protein CDES_13595 [Corynebacterium deserti GIMN1.010]
MRHRSLARPLLRIVLPTLIALATVCVLVFGWFIFPAKAEPTKVDVVLVLAGANDGRHEYGAQLVEEGYADNFVVSNPNGSSDKVGYAHCAGNLRPEGAQSYCMDPYPVITSGEAMTFNGLAQQHGWDSVLIVTMRTHTQRVRTVFDQCYTGESTVLNVDNLGRSGVRKAVFHEIGGYIKFWLTAPCA